MIDLRKDVSIVDYLSKKGFVFHRRGNKWFTNSPFTTDKTPSFCVFEDGAFKDFSTGKAGNVITLAKFFGDDLRKLSDIEKKWVPPVKIEKYPWNGIPRRYLDIESKEKEEVLKYASGRGITRGFEPGCFFTKDGTEFVKHLALIFPHQNNGIITGCKFRAIKSSPRRFSVGGVLGFYVLENNIPSFEEPVYYLIEGEANANSMWEHLISIGKPGVVASAGSVTSIPKKIETSYRKKLLVDFDGDEDKYQSRIGFYKHLDVEPVKLMLPKGEDINSLYCSNQLSIINTFL